MSSKGKKRKILTTDPKHCPVGRREEGGNMKHDKPDDTSGKRYGLWWKAYMNLVEIRTLYYESVEHDHDLIESKSLLPSSGNVKFNRIDVLIGAIRKELDEIQSMRAETFCPCFKRTRHGIHPHLVTPVLELVPNTGRGRTGNGSS